MSDEINVVSRTQTLIVDPASQSVSIINAGQIGPPGPRGPMGPPGSGGGAGGGYYVHIQDVPSTLWTIIHNLGMKPNVTTLVNFGSLVEAKGEIVHTDETTVKVTFATPVTGQALLS